MSSLPGAEWDICVQWSLSIVDTLGPSKVSCIERCPHFRGKLRKHIWDIAKCP